MSSVNILNAKIDNVSLSEVIYCIDSLVKSQQNKYIVTPNVDHLIRLEKDHNFYKIYQKAHLTIADGMPLIWASRYLKTPLKERIAGSDLFNILCARSAEKGYRLFFLGGREGAAEKAKSKMETLFPNINIVGTYCPYLGFETDKEENNKIVNLIKKRKPDILFVGLGSPKQENWIFKYKDLYKVPVSIGVGVSIEFAAGIVKRAPILMQKVGLEWLWRLLMEPKKLWKRYLIDDFSFFYLVYKQKKIGNPD